MCTQVEDINMPVNYSNNACSSRSSKSFRNQINYDKKKCLNLIAKMMEDLIFFEDKTLEKSQYKFFDMEYAIDLPIRDYLARIDQYLKLEEEIYFAALIYIDKLLNVKSFFINKLNVYKYK
jgi:hypothetical protein